MIKGKKIERKMTKKNKMNRQKTFNEEQFDDFDIDTSEMNVVIKEYKTIEKKNSFLKSLSQEKPLLELNNKLKRNNTCKIKNIDYYSIATNTSYIDSRVKKVTFSNVEIIRVEKYKKYNALNNYSKLEILKNMEELNKKNNTYNENPLPCAIF